MNSKRLAVTIDSLYIPISENYDVGETVYVDVFDLANNGRRLVKTVKFTGKTKSKYCRSFEIIDAIGPFEAIVNRDDSVVCSASANWIY